VNELALRSATAALRFYERLGFVATHHGLERELP
jgi:hypothetical protein